jgi:transcriptional regulator with XRE-family HTH domain
MGKPDLRAIIAENIRAYRESAGVSQDEFADQSGLHRTYIGSVERCERNVTLATLELLAKSIGCSVPELLTKGAIK